MGTKQEEIREGIHKITDGWLQTEEILSYLHSKKCVIKVKRELPSVYGKPRYESLKAVLEDHKIDLGLLSGVIGEIQLGMIDEGYTAVETLIEGVPRC